MTVRVASVSLALTLCTIALASQPIYTNVVVEEVSSIDSATETFTVDFYLELWYQDTTIPPGTGNKVSLADGTFNKIVPEFLNVRDKTEVYAATYYGYGQLPQKQVTRYNVNTSAISNAAWVQADSRFRLQCYSTFDLQSFPFDSQTLKVKFELPNFNSSSFQFQPKGSALSLVDEPTGWVIHKNKVSASDHYYSGFDEYYSRVTLSFEVERNAEALYGIRIISTLLITSVMTFLLFLFDLDEDSRQSGAATFFLAAVAYMFVVMADVPSIPYTTRLDNFVIISLLTNLSCYTWFVMAQWLNRKWKEAQIVGQKFHDKFRRYEKWSGTAFFLVYLMMSAIALGSDMPYWGPIVPYALIVVFEIMLGILIRHKGLAAIPLLNSEPLESSDVKGEKNEPTDEDAADGGKAVAVSKTPEKEGAEGDKTTE